jgi:hypothetical protein
LFICKDFIPITKYEKKLKDDLALKYDIIKLFGMTIGLFLRRYTAYVVSMIKKTDVTKNAVAGLIWGISGFYIGQIIAVKYIYTKTNFIKKRLIYEKSIDYVRENRIELFEDYPFSNNKEDLLGDNELKLTNYSRVKKIFRDS